MSMRTCYCKWCYYNNFLWKLLSYLWYTYTTESSIYNEWNSSTGEIMQNVHDTVNYIDKLFIIYIINSYVTLYMNALNYLLAWTLTLGSWVAAAQSKWVATKVSDYLRSENQDTVLYRNIDWSIVILPWITSTPQRDTYPEWLFWNISEVVLKKHGKSHIYLISQDKSQNKFLIKVDWTKDIEKTGWTIFYIVDKSGKILKVFTDYYIAEKAIK